MLLTQFNKFGDWVRSVECEIYRSVANCSPREWNEDHISYSWIRAIRNTQRHIGVSGGWRKPFCIAWDAFKADGALEESNGDIAFLVKQTLPNNKELWGVAFLEAKRVYDSGYFEKLDWEQLSLQSANSSSHRLLLYDTKDVIMNSPCFTAVIGAYSFRPSLASMWLNIAEQDQSNFSTRASVCLPQQAIAYRTKTRQLHELCTPLSHQICLRYFMGHDLDYNPELVSRVANGVHGGVNWLFVVHMRYGEDGEASIETMDFNREIYRTVERTNEDNL
jgi:hypothetical protein